MKSGDVPGPATCPDLRRARTCDVPGPATCPDLRRARTCDVPRATRRVFSQTQSMSRCGVTLRCQGAIASP